MLEPRIVAMSVSRFAEAVAPADVGVAEATNHATLRLGSCCRPRSWPRTVAAPFPPVGLEQRVARACALREKVHRGLRRSASPGRGRVRVSNSRICGSRRTRVGAGGMPERVCVHEW
jgi:hypothetical protein